MNKDINKLIENKNVKDYATLKWEAEVRAELAKKTASQRKLTKDEQTKVNNQLKKEADIRERVQNSYLHLRRGIKLLQFLSDGILSNKPELWFAAASDSLMNILRNNASLLTGSLGVETFLGLTKALNPRLGPLRLFVGVAMLRAADIPNVPENLQEESVYEVVARVLYRIRFLSEQRPLDSISLMYIIPLILLVFQSHGIDTRRDVELADEQVLLAIEALTFHTDLFSDESLQRADTLKSLVALMQSYPSRSKAAKECLIGICQSLAGNITESELKLLLDSTISPDSFVRAAVLEAIDSELEISHIGTSNELWIACHDEDELSRKTAISLWEENMLEINVQTPFNLLPYLVNEDLQILSVVSRSIADAVDQQIEENRTFFHDFLLAVMDMYRQKSKPPEPIYDDFGMIVRSSMEQKDPWEARSGIASTFKEMAGFFEDEELENFVNFLLEEPGPLCDKNDTVRQQMQDAAVLIINLRAKNRVDTLVPIMESCLEAPSVPGLDTQNMVKESAIVLYGTVARHLEDDEKLPPIIERLIQTLKTPSENVQYAVSESLPPLVNRTKSKAGTNVEYLLDQLYHGDKYSVRKGAAYGLAGVVKGVGISALSEYDIIRSLTAAAENKRDAKMRQGVQFAFETLSLSLKQFFEPYVIEILPLLLNSLGDPAPEVRDVTAEAAKEIMKHTSGYGIKQLIPLVLESFNQTQWRSKKGAVELLGTMAYLDPQQLSQSLSIIIPEIVNALNDTHKEVRRAANQSLQRFGEVISNPEIQNLVPILLKAISDPTRYVDDALDSLIKTAFVHYIDAPSLALV